MEGTLTEAQSTPKTNPWGKPNSPWGQKVEVTPCSLEDVMSEQLASQLQKEEEESVKSEFATGLDWSEILSFGKESEKDEVYTLSKIAKLRLDQIQGICREVDPDIQALIDASSAEGDTSSDVALARMLQMQYDQEYNKLVEAQENKYNGTNKVKISFDNYRSPNPTFKDEEDEMAEDDYDEDYVEKTGWNQEVPTFNRQGYAGSGKNIKTKHDAVICGRRNAAKMMNFPPEFELGDGEGMDMKLPNNVYNKLKRYSEAENKRAQRLHEKKEHSTAEQAMDPRTRLLLYKLVNNGTLESISGTISTGKESIVFHAYGGQYKEIQIEQEVAIKVFKTTLNEFKNREKYVHGDHRFSKDDYKKQNPRKIIKMWAMKETANLNRMLKFNIPCPRVQLLKKHCLVMSFIGQDRIPAPKLKDAKMSPEDMEDAYDQVKKMMRKMYNKCGLVHADLSEYNMLWFKDQVWVIDVSQAVDITHPKALEFLHRDCSIVTNFFSKHGVHEVDTPEQLFNHITELNILGTGAEFLQQVEKFRKEKCAELLLEQKSDKQFQFDFFFEKTLEDRAYLQDSKTIQLSDSDSDDEVDFTINS